MTLPTSPPALQKELFLSLLPSIARAASECADHVASSATSGVSQPLPQHIIQPVLDQIQQMRQYIESLPGVHETREQQQQRLQTAKDKVKALEQQWESYQQCSLFTQTEEDSLVEDELDPFMHLYDTR